MPARSAVLFFQAEDGIRGYKVTGVQTCALPISPTLTPAAIDATALPCDAAGSSSRSSKQGSVALFALVHLERPRSRERSEERRVGKECEARQAGARETERTERRRTEVDECTVRG